MKLTPEQWQVVRDEYIKSPDATYRSLAKKYNTSVTTINDHAKRENWPRMRQEYESARAEQLKNQPVTAPEADLASIVNSLGAKLKEALTTVSPSNTKGLREISSSIKDYAELQLRVHGGRLGGEDVASINTGVILLPTTVELPQPPEEAENE